MGKKAPKAPDPWQTASAQGAWNTFTAQQQQQMNMIGQNTPWGTLDYAQTGSTWITDPNGKRVEIPTYTANVALTPEQQAIFERTQEAETNLAQIAADQSARVGEILNTPFEFTNRDAETWAYDLASPRILQQSYPLFLPVQRERIRQVCKRDERRLAAVHADHHAESRV